MCVCVCVRAHRPRISITRFKLSSFFLSQPNRRVRDAIVARRLFFSRYHPQTLQRKKYDARLNETTPPAGESSSFFQDQ